jgi:hypothetical protein
VADKMPVIERRSRIVCHFPMNRSPTVGKPNQLRVVYDYQRFAEKNEQEV